jgi:hypothetical protein
MATAEEIRRAREETSVFSPLFDYMRSRRSQLASEGRRPVLGGLLSKEPVMGTDTLRYEGVGSLLANLLDPIARGVDAPRAAAQGLIPQEDMVGEALGTAGTAMVGAGAAAGRGILDYDPTTTRIFAGPKAKTADLEALKKAKELSARRRDPDEIYKETGWFKGADNQWRFEIPDDKIEFISDPNRLPEYQLNRAAGLGDVIKHDELFAAYPELRGLLTQTGDNPTPYGGWQPYQDRSSEGFVDIEEEMRAYGPTRRDVESVLLHEIDHAVANREGFSGGTNQSEATSRILEQQNIDLYNLEQRMEARERELGLNQFEYRPDTTDPELLQLRSDYDARVGRSPSNQDIFAMYQKNMGEVAARNTESRRDMTAAERRETPPRLTEDTPREAQWTEGVISAASSEPLEGFEGYLSRVNPSGKRIAAEDRPNLMMGDMYGMLPRGSDVVGEMGDVTFHRSPDGDYYATAYNPDVGEQDVVGYITDRGDSTELQVVAEMQGQGIGGELQYLFRSENPDAPTGGLTEAGERSLERTYDRMFDEGLVSANASKNAGAMTLWHGSPYDFNEFDLSKIGTGEGAQDLGRGFSLTDYEANAHLYTNPASRWGDLAAMERYRQAGPGRYYQVNVGAAPEQFLDWNKPWRDQVPEGTPLYDALAKEEAVMLSQYADDPAMQAAIPRGKVSNMWRDNLGLEDAALQSGFVGNSRRNYSGDTEYTVFDPSLLRIDQKFDADGNVVSANASPMSGLLAQSGVSSEQAQEIEDYLLKTGLLQ